MLAFLAWVVASACSGVVQIGSTSTDSGSPDVGDTIDGGVRDSSSTKGETTQGDGGPHRPTLIQSGTALILFGVTTDGYAVYAVDTSTPTLLAAPLAGGAPITIGTVASESFYLTFQGNVVFVYDNLTSTGAATLETWTSTGALQTITSSAFEYSATLGSDGKTLSYFDNFDAGASTADAYVVQADGSGKTLLHAGVPGVGVSPSCHAELGFVGTLAALTYCAATTPTLSGSVYTYAPPSWPEVDVVDDVYPYFSPDPLGTSLLVQSATAGLEIAPVAGGSATSVDATGEIGLFSNDGKTVVYTTTTGDLRSSPVAAPSPTVLVSGATLLGLAGLSPDGSMALVYENLNESNYNHDLYSASALTPGALVTLNASETSAQLFGDMFTTDSSSALFWSGVGGAYLGTLESSGAGAPTELGAASNTAWAAGGSTVVFADGENTPPGSSLANVDIEVIDLAVKPSSSTTLVHGANGSSGNYAPFFLTPTADAVVFTANAGSGLSGGLYVRPVSP